MFTSSSNTGTTTFTWNVHVDWTNLPNGTEWLGPPPEGALVPAVPRPPKNSPGKHLKEPVVA